MWKGLQVRRCAGTSRPNQHMHEHHQAPKTACCSLGSRNMRSHCILPDPTTCLQLPSLRASATGIRSACQHPARADNHRYSVWSLSLDRQPTTTGMDKNAMQMACEVIGRTDEGIQCHR